MSFIFLGNLSAKQMCDRLGIEYTDEIAKMEDKRQNDAKVKAGTDMWHCFDIPLHIQCGTYELALQWRDLLAPLQSQMKGQINIGFEQGAKEK